MADPTRAMGALGADTDTADVDELLAKAEAMLHGDDFTHVMAIATDLTGRPLGNRLACAYLKRTLAHPESLDPRNRTRPCRGDCTHGWKERRLQVGDIPRSYAYPCPDCNERQYRRWRLEPRASHLEHRLDKAQTSRCGECCDVLALGVNSASASAWT